jgi:septal ring factor EnvC (AmiA/AmiB activator)
VKEEKLKGMQVFKNARLSPTDGEVADLYFKVVKKSRNEENASIVYLIMGRPNENVALRTADDAYRIQDAKAFLATLHPQAESYDLERNISRNEDNFKKSEKKLKDLQDDRKRLDKKIQEQEEELNRLKSEKESLLGKRK